MTFHVYENWTHDRCRVHRSDCVFAADGNGINGAPSKRNGQWHGLFDDCQTAFRVAGALKRADTKACPTCSP
jgi:hypothetical protein